MQRKSFGKSFWKRRLSFRTQTQTQEEEEQGCTTKKLLRLLVLCESRGAMSETSSVSDSSESYDGQQQESTSTTTSSRDSIDSETTEEQLSSEDEYAKKLTKKLDAQIARTYHLLKTKDPSIYDERAQFYDETEQDSEEQQQQQQGSDDEPVALVYKKQGLNSNITTTSQLDTSRNNVSEAKESYSTKSHVALYDPEQWRLRKEIMDAVQQEEDNSDDELLTRKEEQGFGSAEEEEQQLKRTILEAERNHTAEEYLLHSYLEKEKPDEAERFLRDYILNDGWVKNIYEAPLLNGEVQNMEIDEQDAEFVEKQEEFEAAYNFRFEEPNATEIVSYGRGTSSSSRAKESKRKRKRARQEMRKKDKIEKRKREWEPQKKEKQDKIIHQIRELLAFCEARGVSYFSLLEGQEDDLDVRQHQQKVKAILDEFGGSDSSALKSRFHSSGNNTANDIPQSCRDKIHEIDRLIDEYFELELEDVVGETPIRYRYRTVEPETFGLDIKDILEMDEKELNELVPSSYVTCYGKPAGLSRIKRRVKLFKKRKSSFLSYKNKNRPARKNESRLEPKKERNLGKNDHLQLSAERMKAYGLGSSFRDC